MPGTAVELVADRLVELELELPAIGEVDERGPGSAAAPTSLANDGGTTSDDYAARRASD